MKKLLYWTQVSRRLSKVETQCSAVVYDSGRFEKLPSKTDLFYFSSSLTACHSMLTAILLPMDKWWCTVHTSLTHLTSAHLTSSHGAASNHSSPVIGFGFNHPSILIPELKVVFVRLPLHGMFIVCSLLSQSARPGWLYPTAAVYLITLKHSWQCVILNRLGEYICQSP